MVVTYAEPLASIIVVLPKSIRPILGTIWLVEHQRCFIFGMIDFSSIRPAGLCKMVISRLVLDSTSYVIAPVGHFRAAAQPELPGRTSNEPWKVLCSSGPLPKVKTSRFSHILFSKSPSKALDGPPRARDGHRGLKLALGGPALTLRNL